MTDASGRDPLHPAYSPSSCLDAIVGQGACMACRGRVTKCNLEQPQCRECVARRTACVYNELPLASPTPPAKRQKVDQPATPYEALFHLMQTEPFEVSDRIFRRIRGGGNAQSVLDYIREGDLLVQIASTAASRSSEPTTYTKRADQPRSVSKIPDILDGFPPQSNGKQ